MRALVYGSVCSGIEAASVAWRPLGWDASFLSEIASAPRAVLEYRQNAVDAKLTDASKRGVPLWGDFSALRVRHMRRLCIQLPDILIGGTPCQGFSIAGLRGSLSDDRSNLALAFIRLAHAIDNARRHEGKSGLIIVWENVPGVLSTPDNAFGCFLGALVGGDAPLVPGRKQRWTHAGMVVGPQRRAAWTSKDSQYFGLAQRRERVFVIACPLDGPDPSEILFEPDGVRRNHPPRRGEEEDDSGALAGVSPGGGWRIGADEAAAGQLVANSLRAQSQPSHRADSDTYVPALVSLTPGDRGISVDQACGGMAIPDVCATLDASYGRLQGASGQDATRGHSHLIPFDTTQITSQANRSNPQTGDPCHPLTSSGHPPALAFGGNDTRGPIDVACALNACGTASGRMDFESETFVTHTLRAEGFDASEDGTGRGIPLVPALYDVAMAVRARDGARGVDSDCTDTLVPFAFTCKDHGADVGEISPTLRAMNHSGSHANAGGQVAVAYPILEPGRRSGKSTTDASIGMGIGADGDPMFTLNAERPHGVAQERGVRRLLPVETERLQGFPDGYTLIPMARVNAAGETVDKWREVDPDEANHLRCFGAVLEARGEPPRWYTTASADGPRYMGHGNSMSVPVIAWIGRRIQRAVDALSVSSVAAE